MNALLESEFQEITPDERFKVVDIESANWCFRKLRATKEKQEEVEKLALQEIARIEAWKQKELEGVNSSIAYFEGLLTEYYKTTGEKVSTPYGKLSSRKSSKWIYQNESELIKYLENSPEELVRVKKELNKAEIKKVFKNGLNQETGEILPYVEVVEEETISIKVEV